MSFRTRLALTFSLLTAGILICMGLLVYILARQYTQREFYRRLEERGNITAQMFLEQDELSANSFKQISRKFFQALPDEVLDIYDRKREPRFILDSTKMVAPANIFELLNHRKTVEFWQGRKQGVGLYYQDNQGDFYIIVSAYDQFGASKLRNLKQILIISVLSSVLIVLAGGYYFARLVLNPIGNIVREVNKIRASNLHLRLHETGTRDEIAQLTQTFNQMLDRLETSFDMQKSFIANASHELRNPLTAISGEIEVALLKDRTVPEYQASLQTLQDETDRLGKLTSDLISLAQTGFDEQEIQREQVRLDELVLEVKSELDRQLPQNQIRLDLEGLPEDPADLLICGSRNLLKSALTNVLENACKFSDNQPVILKLSQSKNRVLVQVQDQGIGIPPEELNNVFQPFYRARNARSLKGTGIGLSMTEKIMRLHGGKIELHSEPDKGTTVLLKFPKKTV